MTKVECPGPGFKGLKWKWIQDHAKEQQEREERERRAVHQLPAPAAQPRCPQQQPGANSSSELLQTSGPCVQQERTALQSGDSWDPPQSASGDTWLSPAGIKVEPAILPASLAGSIYAAPSEAHVRVKEEQGTKAPPILASEPLLSQSLPIISGVLDADGTTALSVSSTMAGLAIIEETCVAGAVPSAGMIQIGVSVSSSSAPTMPAADFLRQKSVDATTSVPATSVSLITTAVVPPPVLIACSVEGGHGTDMEAVAGSTQTDAPQGAAAACCILTRPPVPSPAQAHSIAPTQPSTTSAVQLAATAPSSAPPLGTGAARVRLAPVRAPSMTALAGKGGDDFESMFTPLSSLPSIKLETPRVGATGRSGSVLPGPQTSVPGASPAVVVSAPSAMAAVVPDGIQGMERKGPLKKASRLPEGRSAMQSAALSATAGTAWEAADLEHVPPGTARGRPPVIQFTPALAGAGAASKETPSGVTTAGGAVPVTCAGGKPQAQGQLAQQQPSAPTQQQLLQQRHSAGKPGKDPSSSSGSKIRDSWEATAAAITGGTAAAPTAIGGTLSTAVNRCADRAGAPASAGSIPSHHPAHSGGEAGERKRPWSEGSKPAAGASLTGNLPGGPTEGIWPYGETLADRIKRAKRTTTSSSDQDGPHSHGGSAERAAGQVGQIFSANGGGDGHGTAATAAACPGARGADEGPPRPAMSAEAQSRVAETSVLGENATRGPEAASAGGVKQRKQTAHRELCDKSLGRVDEPTRGQPRGWAQTEERAMDPVSQNLASRDLRVSGGGAATDSSGGGAVAVSVGGGPAGPLWVSGQQPSAGAKSSGEAQIPSSAATGPVTKRSLPELLASCRRNSCPPTKLQRSDPHLPRPGHQQGHDRRTPGPAEHTAVPPIGSSGRTGAGLQPPLCGKPTNRASSGTPAGRVDGGSGLADVLGPPASGAGPGLPAGPSPPQGRTGRTGEGDMLAAGSGKGPAIAGRRGSKDGTADKKVCGPPHAGDALDAGFVGGGTGGGGAGAAGTTTTEPKTDSETRTSRLVECYFEFDNSCRVAGCVSASISGLGSGGSMQAGHGIMARLGPGRFLAGTASAAAPPLPRSGGAMAAPQLLDLGKMRSFKELRTQLQALYDGTLPDEMDSKIIYLDEDGDWIMVTPDEPWASVAATATKILVTNRT